MHVAEGERTERNGERVEQERRDRLSHSLFLLALSLSPSILCYEEATTVRYSDNRCLRTGQLWEWMLNHLQLNTYLIPSFKELLLNTFVLKKYCSYAIWLKFIRTLRKLSLTCLCNGIPVNNVCSLPYKNRLLSYTRNDTSFNLYSKYNT